MNDFGDISMRQIEVFLTVADCKSITIASKKLFISQSSATRMIQKMESYLNTRLLERTNRGVALTKNGDELYCRIKQIYSRMNAAFYDSRNADGITKKVVRVACAENNEIFDEVAVIIKQFEYLYPDLTVDLKLCPFNDMREGILSGRYDCVFTYSVSAKGLKGIETRYCKHFDTFFAISAAANAIENGALNFSKLSDYYIYMSPGARYDLNGTRDMGICRLYGFEPKGIRYVSDEEAVATMIIDNDGFSVCGPGFGVKRRDELSLFKVEKKLKEEQYMVLLWNPESCPDSGRKFVESVPYIKLERRADTGE